MPSQAPNSIETEAPTQKGQPVGMNSVSRRVRQLREAIESEPEECFGASIKAGRAYGVRDNLLCIVDLIEQAIAHQPLDADTAAQGTDAVQQGEVEFEFEVWQDDSMQAGGSATDYADAKAEADHLARMYGQDGAVEVLIYEKRLLTTAPPSAPAPMAGDAVAAELQTILSDARAMGYMGDTTITFETLERAITALVQDRASQAAAPSAPVGDLVSSLQSMRDRMMAALTPKFGDAFDGDFDVMLEAINTMKRFCTVALAQQPAAVDEALAGWIEDGDTIPGELIDAARQAIRMEFGNNGTDGYYKRILVRIFAALTAQPRTDAVQQGEVEFEAWYDEYSKQNYSEEMLARAAWDAALAQQCASLDGALNELRGNGWAVAVHNDYRLGGEHHTFWLFTKNGRAVKGEGRTDAEALAQVKDEIARLADQRESPNHGR